MKYIAKSDHVIIEESPNATTTPGGLHVPESAEKDRIVTGEVVSIGPDVDTTEIGELVLFDKVAGTKRRRPHKDTDLWVLRGKQIMARLEDE